MSDEAGEQRGAPSGRGGRKRWLAAAGGGLAALLLAGGSIWVMVGQGAGPAVARPSATGGPAPGAASAAPSEPPAVSPSGVPSPYPVVTPTVVTPPVVTPTVVTPTVVSPSAAAVPPRAAAPTPHATKSSAPGSAARAGTAQASTAAGSAAPRTPDLHDVPPVACTTSCSTVPQPGDTSDCHRGPDGRIITCGNSQTGVPVPPPSAAPSTAGPAPTVSGGPR